MKSDNGLHRGKLPYFQALKYEGCEREKQPTFERAAGEAMS